jgi:hypothetical protein
MQITPVAPDRDDSNEAKRPMDDRRRKGPGKYRKQRRSSGADRRDIEGGTQSIAELLTEERKEQSREREAQVLAARESAEAKLRVAVRTEPCLWRNAYHCPFLQREKLTYREKRDERMIKAVLSGISMLAGAYFGRKVPVIGADDDSPSPGAEDDAEPADA